MHQKRQISATRKVRESSVGWMLKRLGANLDAAMGKELKKLGLRTDEFKILMTLLEEEGLTQADIGKKTGLPAYATTRNIDALEAKKLVQRRKDELSRRNYRIYLTKDGRSISTDLFKVVRSINEALLSPLSNPDQSWLIKILQKLLNGSNAIS